MKITNFVFSKTKRVLSVISLWVYMQHFRPRALQSETFWQGAISGENICEVFQSRNRTIYLIWIHGVVLCRQTTAHSYPNQHHWLTIQTPSSFRCQIVPSSACRQRSYWSHACVGLQFKRFVIVSSVDQKYVVFPQTAELDRSSESPDRSQILSIYLKRSKERSSQVSTTLYSTAFAAHPKQGKFI